jgi:hypothetical protein
MPSHIVIASPSCGGAEKRFFDVFTGLRRSGADVVLIGPSSLIDRLKSEHPDRQDVFGALLSLALPRWTRLGFIRRFAQLLRGLPRGSRFHYPMNCLWPLHLGRGDAITMSMVDCTRVPSLLGGTVASAWSWISFYFVERIDILNPTMLEAMRNHRAARRMTLTPGGTFLIPAPPSAVARAPTVAFLGRLVPGKGVEALLEILPALWAALLPGAPRGTSFVIAGYGSLESMVSARVQAMSNLGIPVRYLGYATAESLFPTCAVALSLQEPTNFPSRVVAEALTSGCSVVVRDTGDSRRFGNDLPGLTYCNAVLEPRSLAGILVPLLKRATVAGASYADEVSTAARRRFNSQHYIDYYDHLLTGGLPRSRSMSRSAHGLHP